MALPISTEKCFELVASAIKLAKSDLIGFDPGTPEFDSALEFLTSGDIFLSAVPDGVSGKDAANAVLTQVNNERVVLGKDLVPAVA